MNWVVVVRGFLVEEGEEEEVVAGGWVRNAKGAGVGALVGVDEGFSSDFMGVGEETRDWIWARRAALRACSW